MLAYVNQMINSGATEIVVPAELAVSATQAELEEAQRLAKLNGVRLHVESA